jgi:hypothetical protein
MLWKNSLRLPRLAGAGFKFPDLQAAGEDYWPLLQQAVEATEAASARGVDVAV